MLAAIKMASLASGSVHAMGGREGLYVIFPCLGFKFLDSACVRQSSCQRVRFTDRVAVCTALL